MFCRIWVSFDYSKVSVLEKRGHFLDEKVSGKGSLLIFENDHTSYLLHLSGGTGRPIHAYKVMFRRVIHPGSSSHPFLGENVTSPKKTYTSSVHDIRLPCFIETEGKVL